MNTVVEGLLADIDGVRHGQVVVENGAIVAIGEKLAAPQHVFGDDCLIFAGMGDVHIHAREDVSGKDTHKETFATASAAALHGGVVHVADMPNNPIAPIDDASYQAKETLVRQARLPVTFTLYAGIGPGTRPLRRSVPYKAYMGPSVGDLFFRTLDELDQALAYYRGQNVSFHCEDPILLEQHRSAPTHELRRPAECELSATRFALSLVEKYRLTGKLCHYSVKEGLPLIRAAKARGLPVTAEVTPHHLFFDTAMITEQNRRWMQMNPPLRSPADRLAMLEALRDGTADYLATDHAPHTLAEKETGVSGQPHLDTFGPFVAWLLVEAGFTPERIAATCSSNPGTFVNPYTTEKFGRLLPGYVGSLTVLHLRRPVTVRREELKTRCGWSPFEGMTFPGSVAAVFIRGEGWRIAVEREEFWRLIEETRPPDNDPGRHADALTERLAMLEPEEIVSFERHRITLFNEANRCDLWSAIYEIDGGCSDDGFAYFRAWLVPQGRDVFETVLANPEYLGEITLQDCAMSCEEFMGVASIAYERREGGDIYAGLRKEIGLNPRNPRGQFIRTDRGFRRRFPMLWRLLRKPPVLDPSWLAWQGGKIVAAARTIHEGRRWTDLPILADALEDAGCHDAFLLDHCRAGSRHARSCWVTNFLLGWK